MSSSFESIRTRLLQNAAARLGDMPAEHRLFIDHMAWEIAALYRELHRSDDGIRHNLLRRLTPDIQTRPNPAHALVQAAPKQAGVILQPERDLFTAPRLGMEPPFQIYFSPLIAQPLIKGGVRYIAAGSRLADYMGADRRPQVRSAANGRSLHPGVLWLGVHLEEHLPPDRPLCFFLNWKSDRDDKQQRLQQLLPLITWRQGEGQLTTRPGFYLEPDQRRVARYIDAEYLHLHGIERHIRQCYEPYFVSVYGSWNPMPVPTGIGEVFGPDAVAEADRAALTWVQLRFPHGFAPEEVQITDIRLNCFPVLNRKLDISQDFTPAANDGLEVRPLSNAGNGRAALADSGDFFLGMQRVFSRSQEYRPVTFESFRAAGPGYYALQHGAVEANDFRDLQQRLDELLHYLQQQAELLQLLPQYALQQAAEDLERGAANLQTGLQLLPAPQRDLGYYLHLRVLDPQETIHVRFWTTQGAAANGVVTPGDYLTVENESRYTAETIVLLSEPELCGNASPLLTDKKINYVID